MIKRSVLDAVGDTPLIHLSKLYPELPFQLYGKLEGANPGGSLKDRAAWNIIREAMRARKIGPHTVVVESSSGNMGIGLAQACRYHNLRFICVVDSRTTAQHIALLQVYGADVEVVTEPDPVSGEFLQARIARVQELLSELPDSFWPDQYANRHNSDAHARSTMREIAEAMNGDVDYVLCATSTCGTLRGCAEYVREAGLRTEIIAVDAQGSAIFGSKKVPRLIPGFGAGFVPELLTPGLVNRTVHVSGMDCVVGCRRLLQREAILAGGSSGALVTAVASLVGRIPDGSRCVLVLCDRGERYLNTIFSDAWVEQHLGTLDPRWALSPREDRQRPAAYLRPAPRWAVA